VHRDVAHTVETPVETTVETALPAAWAAGIAGPEHPRIARDEVNDHDIRACDRVTPADTGMRRPRA
jgi:hypothetical protein